MNVTVITAKNQLHFEERLKEHMAEKSEQDIVSIHFQQSAAAPEGSNVLTTYTVLIFER